MPLKSNDRPSRRTYESAVRQRQAKDTRRRIVEAARRLLSQNGYTGTTIEAIARAATVSAPTVYSIFKSKSGILAELLNESAFTSAYEETVRAAMSTSNPEARLRLAARIARQIHDAQSAIFDLLRGAGVVAPELAKLEQHTENLRYQRQEVMISSLRKARALRPDLTCRTARDIFWMFTSRDIYRMLVRERGWGADQYQGWLASTLVRSLIKGEARQSPKRTSTPQPNKKGSPRGSRPSSRN